MLQRGITLAKCGHRPGIGGGQHCLLKCGALPTLGGDRLRGVSQEPQLIHASGSAGGAAARMQYVLALLVKCCLTCSDCKALSAPEA